MNSPLWPAWAKRYPHQVCRVRFGNLATSKADTFLTNDFTLPTLTIAQLYKARWQVEIFFSTIVKKRLNQLLLFDF